MYVVPAVELTISNGLPLRTAVAAPQALVPTEQGQASSHIMITYYPMNGGLHIHVSQNNFSLICVLGKSRSACNQTLITTLFDITWSASTFFEACSGALRNGWSPQMALLL